MRALHAPQETLREYLKKHIPTPIPLGDKNILNKRHGTLSLIHGFLTNTLSNRIFFAVSSTMLMSRIDVKFLNERRGIL